jgi:putative two-component system response regulator
MKVLIVEDEFASRKKLEKLVNSMGYETLSAENGQQGYEIWKTERPRIVITDWMMPEMDGIDLTRNIRLNEGSQYTYIIIVTLKKDTDDMIIGMEAGADDFIAKPYVKEELNVRIRTGKRIVEIHSRDTVIMAISKLAESRDPETGGHLERIRYYAKALTTQLLKDGQFKEELDIHFVENIYLTSPLHDIGKIGIPDCILLKSDRLDNQEFEVMKTHTTIGYNTLIETAKKDIKADYLAMSAEIAGYHHEKYNGTGYPKGLKGNDIPLSARIVALADVYDALVSKRVYKSAFTHEISKDIIIKEKNTHFDPIIVDAFIACENEFVKIHDQFYEQ